MTQPTVVTLRYITIPVRYRSLHYRPALHPLAVLLRSHGVIVGPLRQLLELFQLALFLLLGRFPPVRLVPRQKACATHTRRQGNKATNPKP